MSEDLLDLLAGVCWAASLIAVLWAPYVCLGN